MLSLQIQTCRRVCREPMSLEDLEDVGESTIPLTYRKRATRIYGSTDRAQTIPSKQIFRDLVLTCSSLL